MSTPQTTQNVEELKTRVLSSLINIAAQSEHKAKNVPTVAYDSEFWDDLQSGLREFTYKRRAMVQPDAPDSLVAYLRDLEQYGIPLAIGRARNRVENGDPRKIETEAFWEHFYSDITEFETTTDVLTA